MTFRKFCRASARIDGPFQFLSDLLNHACVRDFLVDYNRDPLTLSAGASWDELRSKLDTRPQFASRAMLAAAGRVYREYRRLQRAGLA
jgi:hypothetical protein